MSILAALSLAFAGGWWLGHQSQPVDVDPLGSGPAEEIRSAEHDLAIQKLRAENDDLMQLFDEVYALLAKEGFHIQLDLEQDENGRYRLKTDAAKLTEELKAKLKELNSKAN